MKILVAEDDRHIREGLIEILQGEGYQTIESPDGPGTLSLFDKENPDFVCLDIMMPGMNGYDVCREIRKRRSDVPIVFISAKSEEVDKVLGLELGADDYILKPFGVREVVARIRAVTRRYFSNQKSEEGNESFRMLDLEVHPKELRAYRDGAPIDLSLRDTKILQLLYSRKGNAIDRDTLLDECWGMDYFPSSRALDQHISQLRKRIELDPKDPKIIRTVHGVGYRYDG
ncbi:MAG: response regulator transcription factor [Candidatus Omnitrophica bacterium]|nr:response regulator transcription factor [Candidatus Omnitrophota bacterium]